MNDIVDKDERVSGRVERPRPEVDRWVDDVLLDRLVAGVLVVWAVATVVVIVAWLVRS